tara:strand:+ start:282 stop:407 length:126 start_codon:yes stop_codon:yes gene_type:complete
MALAKLQCGLHLDPFLFGAERRFLQDDFFLDLLLGMIFFLI